MSRPTTTHGGTTAALEYAAKGWGVIPLHTPDPTAPGGCSCRKADCQSVGKHPRTMKGLKDASTDKGTIERWWRMWPDANVGITTGAGLMVLDVDGDEGHDTLAALELEHGDLRTLTARTGSGGLHLYFTVPDDVCRNRTRFADGLDTRGEGGYVVAPPSTHVSGGTYQWVDDYPEIAQPATAWLVELLREKSTNGAHAPAPALPDQIPAGERNAALASLAGSMRRRGASETAIRAALVEENAERCVPPLDGDEVAAVAASVSRYEPAAEGTERKPPVIRLDDFHAYMPGHSYIFEPTREMWPAASVNARIKPLNVGGEPMAASKWLDRNRPVEQMTWAPGEPVLITDRLIAHGGWIDRAGARTFNLYRPPLVQHGDPTMAGPWLEHVRTVFPDNADHIIRWLAHRVQRPHEKLNHALVLQGPQGTGKDTIIEGVVPAVGPWNVAEVSPEQMLGRFNAFLKSVILRLSEARDLGDHDRYRLYDHTKTVIAAPPAVLRVDEKHIREYAVPNVVGVVITTNHRDGIYLPPDDRRHYVAWTERTKDGFRSDYWQRLYSWYEQGGYGHVAAFLAQLDISGFDPKAPPPKTDAFWGVVDAGRAPEDAELADVLDRLQHPEAITLSAITDMAHRDFAEWLRDRRNARKVPHRMEDAGYVPVRNDDANDGRWRVGGRKQTIYARRELSKRDRITAVRQLVRGSR
jgi:hypothetical protein